MMIFLILQTIQMLSHSTVFLHTQTILILKESEIWNALGAKKSLNKKNTTSKGLILLNLPDIFSSLIWIFLSWIFFLKTCQFLSTGCWIWLPPFSESTFLLIVTCRFLKDLFKSKFYPKGFSPKKTCIETLFNLPVIVEGPHHRFSPIIWIVTVRCHRRHHPTRAKSHKINFHQSKINFSVKSIFTNPLSTSLSRSPF